MTMDDDDESISGGSRGGDDEGELIGSPSVGVPSSDEEDVVDDENDDSGNDENESSSGNRGRGGDDCGDDEAEPETGADDGEGGSGPRSGSKSKSKSKSRSKSTRSRWIVAFGFPIAAGDGAGRGRLGDVATSVLQRFESCGEVVRRFCPGGGGGGDSSEGTETKAAPVAVNWVAMKFSTASQAEAALGHDASVMRLGGGVGTLIVGVRQLDGTIARELGVPVEVLHCIDEDEEDDDDDDEEVDEVAVLVDSATATDDDDTSSEEGDAEDGPPASKVGRRGVWAKTTDGPRPPRRRTGTRRSSPRASGAGKKTTPASSPRRRGTAKRPRPGGGRGKRGAGGKRGSSHTEEDAGAGGRKRPTRKRRGPPLPVDRLIEALTEGCEQNRPRGWYRRQLGLNHRLAKAEAEGGGRRVALNDAEKVQILTEVNMLEQYLSERGHVDLTERSDDGSGRFVKRKEGDGEGRKYHPVTKRYLVQVAWGKGNSYINDLQKAVKMARDRMGIAEDDPVTPSPMMLVQNMSEAKRRARGQRSVVDDYDLASTKFTADYLYAVSECRRMAEADEGPIVREEHMARLTESKGRYSSLDDETKAVWEARRSEHLRVQPSIRQRLVEAMQADPNFTWRSLEVAIDHWCSESTIKRWVTGLRGFEGRRSKRTLPEEFL